MANESIGMGATLEYDSGGGFTALARLKEIGQISCGDTESVDFVCYDSADGFREAIAGVMDAGEVDITGVFNSDASQTGLDALRAGVYDYKITLPNSLGTFTFKAIFSGPRINPPVAAEIEFTATLRISGKPTFT